MQAPTMSKQEAIDLAASLQQEADECDTGWSFDVVQSHNSPVWAVIGEDEDGTPQNVWVNPELSFPAIF